MKILFIVIPEKGHINPYIGVAQHLQERGNDLGFYAPHDISEQLGAAGLNCFLGEFTAGPPSDRNRGRYFAEKVTDSDWLRSWIKELLVENAPTQVDRLRSVIREFDPSVIITDPMVYQAAIAAELEGIKWVAISNSMNPVLHEGITSELLETVSWLSNERTQLFEHFGLNIACNGCDMLSPYLSIAFTTREFAGRDVPNVKLVGPSIPISARGDERDFPWDALSKDNPIIYMSLGSQIYYQPQMFHTVFEAVRNKPVQLVATVNELLTGDELGDIPNNVLPVYYTPQLQLLPNVDVMITHGGANSVMEALHFGVPLLISPICNDQFHQVHFIEQAGVGKRLDLASCSAKECWEVLHHLIHSEEIQRNVAHVSNSYQVDGAEKTALLVEELVSPGG